VVSSTVLIAEISGNCTNRGRGGKGGLTELEPGIEEEVPLPQPCRAERPRSEAPPTNTSRRLIIAGNSYIVAGLPPEPEISQS